MVDPIDRARLLAGPPATTLRQRTATVATSTPLTIYVGGSTVAVPARRLVSYAPVVGHHVAVLEQGADVLVLGEIV